MVPELRPSVPLPSGTSFLANPVVAAQSQAAGLHLADACILIVDDETVAPTLLASLLTRAGVGRVEVLHRSAEALDACQRLRPDLVLLDLHMPAPDGLEVLAALRREPRQPGVRPPEVLVMTGDGDDRLALLALQGGAADLVVRPIHSGVALLRIERLLTVRARLAALEAEIVRLGGDPAQAA